MKKVCISMYEKNEKNAGPKAKVDVEKILLEKYLFEIKNMNVIIGGKLNGIKRILTALYYSYRYKDYDIVIIQTPIPLKNLERRIFKKIKNKVLFIHDIDGIRFQDNKVLENELIYYKQSKYIISHNDVMTKFLINNGIENKKIITLQAFDYLVNSDEILNNKIVRENVTVIYPGNLNSKKCPFLYQIRENKMLYTINAYGKGIDKKIENKKIKNCGSFEPGDLLKLNGNLGLVWDGNFDESDINEAYKNYTKYNCPHKFSCCLALGLPVIVWEKSAIANFVRKYNVGYTIRNLYDINDINLLEYGEKQKNAMEIGKKIRMGYYTQQVMNEIMSRINKKD